MHRKMVNTDFKVICNQLEKKSDIDLNSDLALAQEPIVAAPEFVAVAQLPRFTRKTVSNAANTLRKRS